MNGWLQVLRSARSWFHSRSTKLILLGYFPKIKWCDYPSKSQSCHNPAAFCIGCRVKRAQIWERNNYRHVGDDDPLIWLPPRFILDRGSWTKMFPLEQIWNRWRAMAFAIWIVISQLIIELASSCDRVQAQGSFAKVIKFCNCHSDNSLQFNYSPFAIPLFKLFISIAKVVFCKGGPCFAFGWFPLLI
jgi:hypothetical protein